MGSEWYTVRRTIAAAMRKGLVQLTTDHHLIYENRRPKFVSKTCDPDVVGLEITEFGRRVIDYAIKYWWPENIFTSESMASRFRRAGVSHMMGIT